MSNILKVKFYSHDYETEMKIGDYLQKTFLALWKEDKQKTISKNDIYAGLVKAKFVDGKLGEQGEIKEVDAEAAEQLIEDAITLFLGKA